jgi:hypothetical protein
MHLSEASDDQLSNLDALVEPIVSLLERTWEDTDNFKPTAYLHVWKAFENGDTEALEHFAKCEDHAVTNETMTQLAWNESLSVGQVANEAMNFGVPPLESLVKACVIFGMNIEAERNKRKAPKVDTGAPTEPAESKRVVFAAELPKWVRVHMAHCNQGEYEGSCKYGDLKEEPCPALHEFKDCKIIWDGAGE